ncbi:MAG: sensor histidine kinase [Candidatus Anammoxibacter sp.]
MNNNKTDKKRKLSIFHPTRFNLMLFYPITSFLVIAIVSFSVGKILASIEKRELIERSEIYAGFIISNLNHSMYDEFFFPLMETEGQIDLENNPEHFRKLDKVIRRSIYGYNIKKVYLYDNNRRIIYSTVPEHIGFSLNEGENLQLDSALNGSAASILRPPGVTDYRGQVVTEMLLESYYPIFGYTKTSVQDTKSEIQNPELKQVGAMEIYQDMTGLNKQIFDAQHKTTIITASSMGILFISLILIVNKGASIIRLRTKQLSEARDHLEERVKERTLEIEEAYKKLQHAQKQLIQSEKMAGIGKLAAGIAHEINNPLASVAGCAEGLLQRYKDNTNRKNRDAKSGVLNEDADIFPEYLKIIYNETFRCKAIISKLLNFSRQTEPVITELNIINVLNDSLAIFKHQINTEKKKTTFIPGREPVIVKGDEHQLKQVFLNILINASDAIEDVGEIVLKVSKNDANAVITFKDSGCGIKQDDLKRIFDPFFTTKPVGKGTGLGLSICYGIIEGHGGTINSSCEGIGKGATIEIVLALAG